MSSPPRGPRTSGTARAKTRNVARREVDPARQVAWRTLRAVTARDAYANLELPDQLRIAGLHGRDAAFATELAYGALRGQGTYDAVLAACLDRPLDQVEPTVLDALRLGVHQLLAMRVPAHAAVAATVDLVRADIGQGAAGFANAVLRRVSSRDLEGWIAEVAPDRATDLDGHLAVATSHPVWVIRALRDSLVLAGRPAEQLGDLLASDNARPTVTLAALPGLATADELRAEGAGPGRWSPLAAAVTGNPDDVRAVRERRARVQDEGSQLVALAVAAAPLTGADRGRWLDVCAGPGGKAAVLGATLLERRSAGQVPTDATLVAGELSSHRVGLVRGSVKALLAAEPAVVLVRQSDGTEVGETEPGHYDRVLVDAPCTGLGALRRRPEARWRRRPADLAALGPVQRSLLRSAVEAVRPGGVVGYVTCSPHPAETRAVISDLLKIYPDLERLDAREAVVTATGRSLEDLDLGDGPDVQLWPHRHGCDAMYLALLRKRRP